MKGNKKISVTIITGFLGAGKTTFINFLLKKYSETIFALVENEFGEVSIDTKLIKGVDASQMFELKNGCICCTITDEYEVVLQELSERFPNVEHLLIETTGVADPAPVIRPFFRDENLQEIYKYNGTICLVDAINFESQPEKEIALKQIAVADLVLINKSENISAAKKEAIQNKIYRINPLAKTGFAEFGILPEFQLDSVTNNLKIVPDLPESKHVIPGIVSKTISFYQLNKKKEFTDWLSYNLDVYKNEIYRVKGILCFEDEPYEFILQGVGGSFDLTESDHLKTVANSEIVFIGNLDNIDLAY